MKNLFSLLCSVILLTGHAAVAGSGEQNRLTARATMLTRQIALKTPLNEGQYVKVRQLNLRLLSDKQALQTRLANDPTALDQQLAELQTHYEWDLAAILWPRQMAAYNQAKAEFMALSR